MTEKEKLNDIEPNWEGKNIDFNCTATKLSEQLGIELWKTMVILKYKEMLDDDIKMDTLPPRSA